MPDPKERCPGCVAGRDPERRFPVGFCGPACVMRRERDERIAQAKHVAEVEGVSWRATLRERERLSG